MALTKQEEQIQKMMKALGISREEALEVIADDKRIDKGEKLFELSAEQEKASKQGKPTVSRQFTNWTTRKASEAKRRILTRHFC